jgi:NADH-quinone oxidoreductase subunit M
MLSHGLISAALFLCVGVLYDRTHSRLINYFGGVVHVLPKYSFIFMIFVLAALGLPGTSGFVGEFLVLVGTFKVNFLAAILASLGVILAAAYMLWLYKRTILGKLEKNELKEMKDLNKSEFAILFCLGVLVIFFGFYPDPLLDTISVSVDNLITNYNLEIGKSVALK